MKNGEKEIHHSGNKIIHGDNLEALKSLLPEYEGKIKCIYIDPPYNTGNDNGAGNASGSNTAGGNGTLRSDVLMTRVGMTYRF